MLRRLASVRNRYTLFVTIYIFDSSFDSFRVDGYAFGTTSDCFCRMGCTFIKCYCYERIGIIRAVRLVGCCKLVGVRSSTGQDDFEAGKHLAMYLCIVRIRALAATSFGLSSRPQLPRIVAPYPSAPSKCPSYQGFARPHQIDMLHHQPSRR